MTELTSAHFPRRKRDAHKYDFGQLLAVAGSESYSGAACLCAQAASVSGAGLVCLCVPKCIHFSVCARLWEVIVRPMSDCGGAFSASSAAQIEKLYAKSSAAAVGSGMSDAKDASELCRRIAESCCLPTVFDADALNAFADNVGLLRKRAAPTVLTPHGGEFSRLIKRELPKDENERALIAERFSSEYKVTLVLKGHRTIIASPSSETFVNIGDNPGMAKGGSGDVLTGIIGALLAQGFGADSAAQNGVFLHSAAGAMAARAYGEYSMTARNIIEYLPKAFAEAENKM